jgi:hypothetical protein
VPKRFTADPDQMRTTAGRSTRHTCGLDRRRMSAAIQVIHVGPDMYSLGGTQSVIRVIRDNKIGADEIRVLSTWNGPSHAKNLFLTARSAVALTRASRTNIVHFHMTNGGAWLRKGALIRLARARGFRVVVTIHGYDLPEFARSHPRMVGATLNHANHVILLSEKDRAVAMELVPSVPTSVLECAERRQPLVSSRGGIE